MSAAVRAAEPRRAEPRRAEPRRRGAVRRAGAGAGLAWLLLPLLPLVLWASADRWPYPAPLPTDLGTSGWRQAAEQGAGPALVRSAVLGLVVAALATPAGAMAGRVLALVRDGAAGGRARWARPVEVVLLAPVAVPPLAVVLGLDVLALRLGVPGAVALVLVLVVAALPYTTFVMRSAYTGYDTGYEDEARTLGASPRQVLARVHLPLAAPALGTAAFLAFLVGWSDYVVTLVVGGGQLVTLPLLVGALSSASGNDAVVAAASVAAVVPPLALLVLTGLLARRGRAARGAHG